MTLAEWVAKYEKKTGEQFSFPDGFKLAFDEKHGFFTFTSDVRDGVTFVNIGATCVNEWKWVIGELTPLAKSIGARYFATATKRNPKAYAKLTGTQHKPEYDYDGYKVFVREVI